MAQTQYERAKVPLSGTILSPTSLLQSPQGGARILAPLRQNSQIIIIGRAGAWFQVEATGPTGSVTGWVPTGTVRVVGVIQTPSRPQPREEEPAPEPANPSPRQAVSEPSKTRIRFIPHGGLAYAAKQGPVYEAKNVKTQIRVGADLLFEIMERSEFGFTLEGEFRKITIASVGPTFVERLRWPEIGPIRMSILGGFSGYVVRDSGTTDMYYGPRMGLDFTYAMPNTAKEIELLARVSADVFLFGKGSVSIPLLGMVGAAFHF